MAEEEERNQERGAEEELKYLPVLNALILDELDHIRDNYREDERKASYKVEKRR